jgi:flagellar basal-body rod modification protein FlgD
MPVDGTSSRMPAQPTVGTGSDVLKKRASELGADKEQFMQLLVAQLKNQDPMSPLQPHEMAAQLAQFSTLEQLVGVNETLKQGLESNAMTTLAMQTNLGASLIGKEVVVGGDLVDVRAGEPAKLVIDAPTGGGQATVTFTDAAGVVVGTKEIGAVRGGRQTLSVPGMPDGTYHFAVEVTNAQGVPVAASTFTAGTVDALHFEGGIPMLRMGRIKVPLTQLAEIQPAAGGSSAAAPASAVTSLYAPNLTLPAPEHLTP